MKSLTIVTPFLNEQESILDFIIEIERILLSISEKFKTKLLLIDDGSTDRTVEIIDNYPSKIEIQILKLDKNYGHQFALFAGLNKAKNSDFIITLDSDLQDPPIYINNILELFQNGSNIVMTKRIKRQDTFVKKINAYIYYRILKFMLQRNDILDSGDYWGIDIKSLNNLIIYQNKKILYFRGQLTNLNLNISKVEINRAPRMRGISKYGYKKMLSLGLSGIFCKFDIGSRGYWSFNFKFFLFNTIIFYLVNYFLGNTSLGYIIGLILSAILVIMNHLYLVSEIDKKNKIWNFIESDLK